MPPWPRIHLFFFSLLWFLPVGYSLLFQKGIPFFPQGVNRLAAFCPQSGSKPKVWESYYVEAQAGNISNEWVPLNLADFSALQAVDSGRSRLEQMIANSERQTGGDKVRAAALPRNLPSGTRHHQCPVFGGGSTRGWAISGLACRCVDGPSTRDDEPSQAATSCDGHLSHREIGTQDQSPLF